MIQDLPQAQYEDLTFRLKNSRQNSSQISVQIVSQKPSLMLRAKLNSALSQDERSISVDDLQKIKKNVSIIQPGTWKTNRWTHNSNSVIKRRDRRIAQASASVNSYLQVPESGTYYINSN